MLMCVTCSTGDKSEQKKALDKTKIVTLSQLVSVLNRALDIMCERHSKAHKEVEDTAAKAQARVVEMRESMYKEVEAEYEGLCEGVLEAEEKGCVCAGAERARLRYSVPSKCCVAWGLKMASICVQSVLDTEGAERLLC